MEITVEKPSRIFFRSTLMNFFTSNSELPSKCMLELRKTFHRERKIWKERYLPLQPMISSKASDELKLIEDIKSIAVPNYDQILQRLDYFDSNLNSLLFNDSVPCALLKDIFINHFDRTTHERTKQSKRKNLHYQPISLILSIAALTELFTTDNELPPFFLVNKRQILELSIRTLNYSKFIKRPHPFAILSLLSIIFSLMIYGNDRSSGFDYMNLYPLFRTCYNVSMATGLYMAIRDDLDDDDNDVSNPKRAIKIPSVYLKRLWNFLLVLDTEFCLNDIKPLIDLKYCHGYYPEEMGNLSFVVEYTNTVRKIPKLFHGLADITFEDLITLQMELSKLSKLSISIDKQNLTQNKWFEIRFKLRLLKIQSSLLTFIIIIMQKSTSMYVPVFSDIKNELIIKYKLNFLYILKIKQFLEPNIKLSYKFMIYFRQELWNLVGLSSIDFLQYLFQEVIHNQLTLNQNLSTSIDYSITHIEKCLFEQETTINPVILQPAYLLKEMDKVFVETFKSNVKQYLNYNCFLLAKLSSAFVVLLKVCYELMTNHGHSLKYLDSNIKKIISKTNHKLKRDVNKLQPPMSPVNPYLGMNADSHLSGNSYQDLNQLHGQDLFILDNQMEQVINNIVQDGNIDKMWESLNLMLNEEGIFDHSDLSMPAVDSFLA